MRKLSLFMGIFVLALGVYSQSIFNVRIDPAKNSYPVGSKVKIYWDFSDITSSAKVKITIWKENAQHVSCKIAEDIPITRGGSGFEWRIFDKCRNPRTGQKEILYGNIKIRVRWQGHRPPVFGESPYFKLYYTDEESWEVSYPAQVAPGFIEVSNARMSQSPITYDESFLAKDTYEYNFEVLSKDREVRLPLYVLVDNLRGKDLEGKICVVSKGTNGFSIIYRFVVIPTAFNFTISPHGWKIIGVGHIVVDKNEIKRACGHTTTLIFGVFATGKGTSCRDIKGRLSKEKTLKVHLLMLPPGSCN